MKKGQRLLAALTAAGMAAAAVPAVAVFADDSGAVTPSKYLQDQKGTLTMTVSGDRDVRVKIEKDTLDGVITYYDTTLENDGTYDFTLDSCEYNVNTETYDSSFTVSVWDKADSGCSYTEEHLVVMDPGFTQTVERSQFDWNLTLQEGDKQDVSAVVTDASVQDGIWAGGTDLTMQYVPYTLGDVDNDGFIDSTDVFELLLYVAKKSSGQKNATFTGDASSMAETVAANAADIDKSGDMDSTDLYYLLYYIALNGAGVSTNWEEILAN